MTDVLSPVEFSGLQVAGRPCFGDTSARNLKFGGKGSREVWKKSAGNSAALPMKRGCHAQLCAAVIGLASAVFRGIIGES